MTPIHADLWQRISSFSIDGPEPATLSFAKRLARENGWTVAFAERTVLEYKRFVFLAMTSGHPVCPSEQVDQAWHLHLTYTRSYWDRFCKEVLGRPLHHDPTRGGSQEAAKHERMYESTLADYRRVFNCEPPADCWPPTVIRFSDDIHHRQVSTKQNWVVPKGPIKRGLAAGLLLTAVGGCIGPVLADAQTDRQMFLLIYAAVMVGVIAIGTVFRRLLRRPDGAIDLKELELDRYDTALLAGGPIRVFDTALVHLIDTGALAHTTDGKIMANGPLDASADLLEKQIYDHVALDALQTRTIDQIRKGVQFNLEARQQNLRDKQLSMTTSRSLAACLIPIFMTILVAIMVAAPRLKAGIDAGKPTTFLVLLMVGAIVAAFIVFVRRPRRTLRGDNYIKASLTRYAEIGSDALAARANLVLGTALLGTAVLASTEFASLGTMLHPRNDPTSSGSGCSSGCSGGDGGGGGCGGGGCGGGGD
ncbi:MAG: TIGR04222 domain-containing membrane protein [Planctomycetes bacterium]|nr:TIGR04222 domain-containing membrane protein [Planctomycetota bacterium]